MARRNKTFRATAYHIAIGQAVMELQEKRGLSLERLADRSRLGPTILREIQMAQRESNLTDLKGLADAFGMELSNFLRSVERHQAVAQRTGAGNRKRRINRNVRS
jgi:ribosome-binding protein aMBF1 (putative translation factor)